MKTVSEFKRISENEREHIKKYVLKNKNHLVEKYGLTLTQSRVEVVSAFYCRYVMDIGNAIQKIKSYYDEIKKLELSFFKKHDINIVLEEDAVDYIIEQLVDNAVGLEDLLEKLSKNFQHGLKLVLEKTGRNRFFLSREALMNPEAFLNSLIKDELSKSQLEF